MSDEERKANGHKAADFWTRIIGAIGGALILALQGVNLSETSGQTNLIHRIDVAIEQQSSLIREVNKEGIRVDQALENQQKMIEGMDSLLHNQNLVLDIMTKQQDKK
jgi:hypothetical protein